MKTLVKSKSIVYASLITVFSLLFLVYMAQCSSNKIFKPRTLTATVSAPERPLPLYGFNGNNTTGPSWENKAFRDSTASFDLKIIRYPGGSVGDYWDWRKGWFVNDQPTENSGLNLTQQFKTTKFSPTGLAQLKLLKDETGCQVVFVVNMLTRDVDDQISMLTEAEKMGIPVKWVELGNEFNIKNQPYRQKFPTAADYGRDCERWIQAIKGAFPEVKIAVVGGNYNYSDDMKNWNAQVLSAAPNADAVVAHIYCFPDEIIDNDGINFSSLYQFFEQQYDSQGFGDIRRNVWLTEYNIHWAYMKATDNKEQMQRYSATWSQALATILMTSLATTVPNQQPEIILNHNISGAHVFAALETEKSTFRTLPNGIGMKLWLEASNHAKNCQKLELRDGRRKVDDFDVLCWKFSAGNSSKFLLVNFTDDAVTVDLSKIVSGAGPINYVQYNADKNFIPDNEHGISITKKNAPDPKVSLDKFAVAILSTNAE